MFATKASALFRFISLAAYLLSNVALAESWTASVDQQNDPAQIATLPAAALMYRQGHVQEASTIYAFAPSKEQLFTQTISPENAIALRTAGEKNKLVITLPQTREWLWLEKSPIPARAEVIADSKQSLSSSDAAEAVSDTGELRRNWEQGTVPSTCPVPRRQWVGLAGRKSASRAWTL